MFTFDQEAAAMRARGFRVICGEVISAGPPRLCLVLWDEGSDLASEPVGIVLGPVCEHGANA